MRLAILAVVLVSSASAWASDIDFAWKKNADAIVASVQSGLDLSKTGLANLLHAEEFEALENLKGCSATPFHEVTKNFAATDFVCGGPKLTMEMRFRDDGSLFALSVNPVKSNFRPTEAGMNTQNWPSREASAKAFAKAVIESGDASLSGRIPITPLQATQIKRLADGRWEIQTYMTEAEKKEARKVLGSTAKFAERPKDGVEIVFSPARMSGLRDKFVTIFFDDENRAIGVHMEDSLLAVSFLPGRN